MKARQKFVMNLSKLGGDINDFNDPPILIVVIDNKIRVKWKH